jgi:hypothetical protein
MPTDPKNPLDLTEEDLNPAPDDLKNYDVGPRVTTPAEIRISDQELIRRAEANESISPEEVGYPETIPAIVKKSWETAGSPALGTDEYKNWYLKQKAKPDKQFGPSKSPSSEEEKKERKESKDIPRAILLYPDVGTLPPPLPHRLVDYRLARSIYKTSAIEEFEKEHGTQQEYTVKLQQAAQEDGTPTVNPLAVETDYLVRKNAFIASKISMWRKGRPVDEVFPGMEEANLEEIKSLDLNATPAQASPHILREDQKAAILSGMERTAAMATADPEMMFETLELQGPKKSVFADLSSAANNVDWWKKAPWEPWYDETQKVYNIVIRPDGEITKPLSNQKIHKDTIGFANLDTVAKDLKRSYESAFEDEGLNSSASSWFKETGIIYLVDRKVENALSLLYAAGIGQHLIAPQEIEGTTQIAGLKNAAVNMLLKHFDKVGQYVEDTPSELNNIDIIEALAQKAAISSYYYGKSAPDGAFKITISTAYLEGIPRIRHRQDYFEAHFGDGAGGMEDNSYYDDYWAYKINPKEWQQKIDAFEESMKKADKSLKKWIKEEAGATTPEDFSFNSEFAQWMNFKNDLTEFLEENDAPSKKINTSTSLFAPPMEGIYLVVDQSYKLRGVYTKLHTGHKSPAFYKFDEYVEKTSFSPKNIFYTIYMDALIDDLQGGAEAGVRPWQEIIKTYPILYGNVKFKGECEEPPNKKIMTAPEAKKAEEYYSNLKNQRCFFEMAEKRRYSKGDPNLTKANETKARINNIKRAYSEFLNEYNQKRIIRELIVCLMQIVGLNLSCKQILKMTLQQVGVNEFVERVIVPLLRFSQELGQYAVGMSHTSFAGSKQLINERTATLKREYYQNEYYLRSVQSEPERKKLIDDNQKIYEEILRLQGDKKIADQWTDSLENIDEFLDELGRLYDLDELCAKASVYLEQVIDKLLNGSDDEEDEEGGGASMWPEPPTFAFERLPITDLLGAIGDALEKAVFDALEKMLTDVVKTILAMIQLICNSLKITIDTKGKEAPNPLSKEDMKDLFDTLIGNQPPALDNMLDTLGTSDTDVAEALEALLNSIIDSLTAAQFCSLLEGNAPLELLAQLRAQFNAVPILRPAFPHNESVKQYFLNMRGLITVDFCTALLEIEEEDLIDLCDASATDRADESQLGEDNAANYAALKDQLSDLLDKLIDALGRDPHEDMGDPTEQPCVDNTKPSTGAATAPAVDMKNIPVMKYINDKAIESFYQDVIDRFGNGVPSLLKMTVETEETRQVKSTTFDISAVDKVRGIAVKLSHPDPIKEEHELLARKIHLSNVLGSLRRMVKDFEFQGTLNTEDLTEEQMKLGVSARKDLIYPATPIDIDGLDLDTIRSTADAIGLSPEAAVQQAIKSATDSRFTTIDEIEENNRSAINYEESLIGQTIIYAGRMPEKFGASRKLHNLLKTPEGINSLYHIATGSFVGISAAPGVFNFSFELPDPPAELLGSFTNPVQAGYKGSFKAGINPQIEFDIRPHLDLNEVDDTIYDSTVDAYTLSYQKTIEAQQQWNAAQPGVLVEDALGRVSQVTPDILQGTEEYLVQYRDYVPNNNLYEFPPDNNGKGRKSKYFFDFLAKKTSEYTFEDLVLPDARNASKEGALFNEITEQILFNTFRGMSPPEESKWRNPFFEVGEVESIELIPKAPGARATRAYDGMRLKTEEETAESDAEAVQRGILEKKDWSGGDDRFEYVKLGPKEPRGDLLSLDAIKELVKKEFMDPPACSDEDDPYGDKDIDELQTAALAGVVYLTLRISTVEFLLKVFPCLSDYKVEDIFRSSLVAAYIIQRMKINMMQEKSGNYYCEFILAVKKIFYDRVKKSGSVVFVDPMTGLNVPVETDDQKLVFLLREQLISLAKEYEFILKEHIKKSAVINKEGTSIDEKWRGYAQFEEDKIVLKPRTLKDTIFAHPDAVVAGKVFDVPFRSQGIYGSNSSAHYGRDDRTENRFFVERYVRVDLKAVSDPAQLTLLQGLFGPGAGTEEGVTEVLYSAEELDELNIEEFKDVSSTLGTPSLSGVVNFNVWENFMAANPDFFMGTKVLDYFENISLGVRVLYIPKTGNGIYSSAPSTEIDTLFAWWKSRASRLEVAAKENAYDIIEVHPPPPAATGAPPSRRKKPGSADPSRRTPSKGDLRRGRGDGSIARETTSWVVLKQEFHIDQTHEWTPEVFNMTSYLTTLPEEKVEIWNWLLEEMYQTEDYKYMFEYLIPADRVFASAFTMSDLYISNFYYETNSALQGAKKAMQKLLFILSSEDKYATDTGCDNTWEMSIAADLSGFQDLLKDLGKSFLQVIMDTVMAMLGALLQLAGTIIDPFGILRMILCPFLDEDHPQYGGMMKALKKKWECKDLPSLPELEWPPYPDNCPPFPDTSCRDLDADYGEPIPTYSSVKVTKSELLKREMRTATETLEGDEDLE